MISALALILFGSLLGQFYPSSWRQWVRGAWGRVSGAVMGSPPARADAAAGHESAIFSENNESVQSGKAVTANRDTGVSLFSAAGNIASFFANLIGWIAKHPLLTVGLVVLLLFALFGAPSCRPFGLGKSNDVLRLEREIAEMRADVKDHEARMGTLSRDLAVNTERDRTRRATVIAQAEQDLGNAAAQIDLDALYDVYASQYLCLLDARACPSRADPAPTGPPPVRGSSSSPA